MGAIQITQWECDTCGAVYDNEGEYCACMDEHAAEAAGATVGASVTVEHSQSTGEDTWEAYYTTGRVVATRKGQNGPEALVEETDGERAWHEARYLVDAEKNKAKAEARKNAPPVDYSNCSSASIIVTYRA